MGRRSDAASTRAQKAARTRRRNARRATVRATSQLVVVLAGGCLAGGLAVLAAFPAATGPVPSPALLGAAGLVGLGTLLAARHLRPLPQGRSRR